MAFPAVEVLKQTDILDLEALPGAIPASHGYWPYYLMKPIVSPAPGYAIFGLSENYGGLWALLEVGIDVSTGQISNAQIISLPFGYDPVGQRAQHRFECFPDANAIVCSVGQIYYHRSVRVSSQRWTYGSTYGSLAADTPMGTTDQGSADGSYTVISPTRILSYYSPSITSNDPNGLNSFRVRASDVGGSTFLSYYDHRGYTYDPTINPGTWDGGFSPMGIFRTNSRTISYWYAYLEAPGNNRYVGGTVDELGNFLTFTDNLPTQIANGDGTFSWDPLWSFLESNVTTYPLGRGSIRFNHEPAYQQTTPVGYPDGLTSELLTTGPVARPALDMSGTSPRWLHGQLFSDGTAEGTFTPVNGNSWGWIRARWNADTGEALSAYNAYGGNEPLMMVSEDPPLLLTGDNDGYYYSHRAIIVNGAWPEDPELFGLDNQADESPERPRAEVTDMLIKHAGAGGHV